MLELTCAPDTDPPDPVPSPPALEAPVFESRQERFGAVGGKVRLRVPCHGVDRKYRIDAG